MDGTVPATPIPGQDPPSPTTSISDLYKLCRESVERYRKSRSHREGRLFHILGRALELYRLSQKTADARAELKQLMKENGVRITKRTENEFTPIVKLIFKGEVIENEKSLVMRCAGILRRADNMTIEPNDIGKFVGEQGGIVECYRRDREVHTSPAASDADPIDLLRQNSCNCDATMLRHLVPEGLINALLEVAEDGSISLLGARLASAADIRRYKTSPSLTAAAGGNAKGGSGITPATVEDAEPAKAA